jgi:hypothetical protein
MIGTLRENEFPIVPNLAGTLRDSELPIVILPNFASTVHWANVQQIKKGTCLAHKSGLLIISSDPARYAQAKYGL